MNDPRDKRIDQLIAAIDKAYHHPGRLAWRGFLMGLASGLGATLGVAIILALLGFIMRSLGGLPGIGDWLNNFSRQLPGNF